MKRLVVRCTAFFQGGLWNFALQTGDGLEGTAAPQTQLFLGAEVKPQLFHAGEVGMVGIGHSPRTC